MSLTGRQIVMERLGAAIKRATTADVQRAAMFLEWAWDVRQGCSKQRKQARGTQATAWQTKVDSPANWDV